MTPETSMPRSGASSEVVNPGFIHPPVRKFAELRSRDGFTGRIGDNAAVGWRA